MGVSPFTKPQRSFAKDGTHPIIHVSNSQICSLTTSGHTEYTQSYNQMIPYDDHYQRGRQYGRNT